jgi:hypothetical protein
LGLLLLILTFALCIPSGNTGPLALLVPFIVGWLGFRAPLLAFEMGRSYWFAARVTLLVEIVSTTLVSAGAAPMIVLLEGRWYPYTYDLRGPFFWAIHVLAAFAGALAVYSLYLWMAHRGFWIWPVQSRDDGPPPLPSLRTAWGALLASLIALIIAIVYIV